MYTCPKHNNIFLMHYKQFFCLDKVLWWRKTFSLWEKEKQEGRNKKNTFLYCRHMAMGHTVACL